MIGEVFKICHFSEWTNKNMEYKFFKNLMFDFLNFVDGKSGSRSN